MARKTSKFMVGLFTTLGIILGVIAIIWIGASKYFEKGARYIAYFDESVQGLQKDSAVKYRGVEVGRVESIRVAPDNKLIGVVMKINLRDEDLTRTAVAQLKVAGITGLVFVELDRRKPGEPEPDPQDQLSFRISAHRFPPFGGGENPGRGQRGGGEVQRDRHPGGF